MTSETSKNIEKTILNKAWGFVSENAVEAVLGTLALLKGGSRIKMSGKWKGVVEGLRGVTYEGGPDSLEDETHFQEVLDKADQAKVKFVVWYLESLPVNSADWKERQKALETLEQFRMITCRKDVKRVKIGERTKSKTTGPPNKRDVDSTTKDVFSSAKNGAVPFIEQFGDRIEKALKERAAEMGLLTLTPQAIKAAGPEALKRITAENMARGLPHMPTADETHWTDDFEKIPEYLREAADVATETKRKMDDADPWWMRPILRLIS